MNILHGRDEKRWHLGKKESGNAYIKSEGFKIVTRKGSTVRVKLEHQHEFTPSGKLLRLSLR